MSLLVIEDDAKTADFVSRGLRDAGYSVDLSTDGEHGLSQASSNTYDLVILDLMLPKIDGIEVLNAIRKTHPKLPVIILSAKKSLDDKLTGLRSGGDDYMVKPFSFEELLVRIENVLRRSAPSEVTSQLTIEDLTVDFLSREVKRGQTRIELQSREFSLLELLIRNHGKALSKSFLLEKIWAYYFNPQTNIVDVLVCRLRAKIDKDFDTPLIHTIRGVGYVFGKSKIS